MGAINGEWGRENVLELSFAAAGNIEAAVPRVCGRRAAQSRRRKPRRRAFRTVRATASVSGSTKVCGGCWAALELSETAAGAQI